MSDQKFWNHVSKGDGCWEYSGAKNTHGYGWVSRSGTQMSAQRWAWILTKGPIPKGVHVLHKCDNRACVNPEHLYLGSHSENMRDRADRRRMGKRQLSKEAVAEVRALRAGGATCEEIAAKFGISNGQVSAIARGIHYGRE